ncbi:STAS domain-containing protein [Sorangium sp. So ce1335]|uniref:STAS domain-containing protein n=1 Tax=Sorangium sp. So ce1335 TaxID=3133335 RepID=UPI003F601167
MGDASNTLFAEFFACCPEMLFVASAEGELVHQSNALREALELTGEERSTLTELAHPEDRAALLRAWSELQQTGGHVCFFVRLRDGSGGYLRLKCSVQPSPDRSVVFGSLQVAPELGSEGPRELRLKARILDALAEHLDDVALWALDGDATCVYHAGKGLARSGLKPGQLVGANWFELFAGDPGSDGAEIRAWFDGKVRRFPNDSLGVWWDNWLIPIRGEQGEPAGGVLGVSLDISKFKAIEEELREQVEQIAAQQRVIRDLSTPIIEVWDGVLTLPMVGTLDSVRTADVMDSLLSKIVEKQARYAILDLTGVEVVDTRVASHLIELVTAIRLLGADGIVAGIKPNVAHTMVALGLDLSQLNTQRDLRAALSYAIRNMTRAQGAPRAGNPAPAG